jgi:2-C-methyl-D-erythritol 4-phosphate cytidylyltransferase
VIKKERKHIIIVAGGKGSRMGTEIPKQFLLLKDKPVLMHTINLFFQFDKQANIILVLPETQIEYWKGLIKKYLFTINHKIIKGGKERFFSVKNALSSIKEEGGDIWIHDGVRPLVSKNTLTNIAKAIKKHKAVVPMLPIEESIRKTKNGKTKTVNRENYRLVQTPQVFKNIEIQNAYKQEYQKQFTDDASVYEYHNGEIHSILGNKENIKITTTEDLSLAEYYLKSNIK